MGFWFWFDVIFDHYLHRKMKKQRQQINSLQYENQRLRQRSYGSMNQRNHTYRPADYRKHLVTKKQTNYDQFKNYEQRGQHFKQLVHELGNV